MATNKKGRAAVFSEHRPKGLHPHHTVDWRTAQRQHEQRAAACISRGVILRREIRSRVRL